jgi:glycosyltransferase involved in cell wall biosynthesis
MGKHRTSDNPLVSISIPCYNYGRYLGDAIESALKQTYKPVEIIVVNDGSSDNTVEVAHRYPVTLITQSNIGAARTFNKCISSSTAEYCVILSADDKIASTYVEKTMQMISMSPDIAFVYTNVTLFGAENRVYSLPEYSLTALKKDNFINGSALMKKSAFMQTNGFDPKLSVLEDWDLWLSFAEKGFYGKLLPEPLLFWRRHSTGSRNTLNTKADRGARWRIIKKHRRLYTLLELSFERFHHIIRNVILYNIGTKLGLIYLLQKMELRSLVWHPK